MGKSKVTVIIPVYNTEKYVEESVLSILNQSLKEIEVIVVNDGSTDNSLAIIEHLAASDKRVKLISQANSGQGVARNNGLQSAQGEYIYFMDSDDILRSDALERCYEKCVSEKLDLLFFDAENFENVTNVFADDYYKRTHKLIDRIYDGCEVMNELLDKNGFRVSVCINVIRKELLDDNNLKFQNMRVHEDEIFAVELFCCAKRVGFINEPFFNRRIRTDSTMTTKFSMRNANAYFYIASELQKYANNNAVVKKTVEKYINRMINAAVRKFHHLTFNEKCHIASNYLLKHTKYSKLKTIVILFLK